VGEDLLCIGVGFVVAAMAGQGKEVGYVAHLIQRPHTGEACLDGRVQAPAAVAEYHMDELSLVIQ
jgi:hypothetical protein